MGKSIDKTKETKESTDSNDIAEEKGCGKADCCKSKGPYIIFSIAGGVGKNIMATAVITSIKAQYPNHRLIIVTGYPEVYLNNPKVYRVFKFGITPYFMEDYVKDDTLVMQIDPYHHDSFIHKKKHLIDAWCETYNVRSITHRPEIYLTQIEIENARLKYARNKPLFVIQTNGGAENQNSNYSWARDIPLGQAQVVVDIMNQTHHVMHIRRPTQLALNNVEAVSASLRELFSLILISDKRLFNESFGYHCAAAFGLPSTVCFIGTLPAVYSYEGNTNIIPQEEKKFIHTIDKYMEDSPWGGEKLYECPYDLPNLFSVTQIVESIKKQPTSLFVPFLQQPRDGKLLPVPNEVVLQAQQNGIPAINPNFQQPDQFQQQPNAQSQIIGHPTPIQNVGNFIDNYFNKIYIINLDKRKERWVEIEKQLASAGINKYERMPGVIVTEKELATIPKEDYANFRGIKTIADKEKFEKQYIDGALGCRKAHLNCITDAQKNKYGKILILEDDVVIDKNANQLFANIINEVGDQWGMLYLGGDYWDNNKTFQTSSYALDAKLFEPILANAEKSGKEIDFFYVEHIQPNFKVLRATPTFVYQVNIDSDIPTMEVPPKKIKKEDGEEINQDATKIEETNKKESISEEVKEEIKSKEVK